MNAGSELFERMPYVAKKLLVVAANSGRIALVLSLVLAVGIYIHVAISGTVDAGVR
jgi:hypothetical protein